MMHSGFAELNKQVTKLLSSLVTRYQNNNHLYNSCKQFLIAAFYFKMNHSIFIIERQPPQVIKTNSRFTAMVRLLIGGQLDLRLAPPKVIPTFVVVFLWMLNEMFLFGYYT